MTSPPDEHRSGIALPPTSSEAGMLRPDRVGRDFEHERLEVTGPAGWYVEQLWTVAWDTLDQPPESVVIPHPAPHLTVESGPIGTERHGHRLPAGLVHGVITQRFRVDLIASGRVFGVKWRPGGLTALTGADARSLRDRVVPAAELFGSAVSELVDAVLAEDSDAARGAIWASWFVPRAREAGPPEGAYAQVLEIFAASLDDRSLVRVADLSTRFELSERALERLFLRYVGVSPKWVLRRHRLHDAQQRLIDGEVDDLTGLAGLAAELGWHDQAHFTREFTRVLGVSPARYLSELDRARATSGQD